MEGRLSIAKAEVSNDNKECKIDEHKTDIRWTSRINETKCSNMPNIHRQLRMLAPIEKVVSWSGKDFSHRRKSGPCRNYKT